MSMTVVRDHDHDRDMQFDRFPKCQDNRVRQ